MLERRYSTTARYNYGSTAPVIDHEVYTPQSPRIPRQEGPRKQRKHEQIQILKRKCALMLCIGIMFSASAAFVWGCAIVSRKQYELKQAKTQIRELKTKANTTKALIAASINLDHIKNRAIHELNMTEPMPHQIVYLDIPKTSYTVVETAETNSSIGR